MDYFFNFICFVHTRCFGLVDRLVLMVVAHFALLVGSPPAVEQAVPISHEAKFFSEEFSTVLLIACVAGGYVADALLLLCCSRKYSVW